jgi:DNA-binding transcriptional ArsR family regulator
VHVLNLSERSQELVVTFEQSLAAELLSSLCVFSFAPDYHSLELGSEWFTEYRAIIPADLLEIVELLHGTHAIRLWEHLLGLVHETPPPRDVPGFLAQVAATSSEELRRHLLGYYQSWNAVPRDVIGRAAEGDEEALATVLAELFPETPQREQLRARIFPDAAIEPEGTKIAILDTLQRWYEAFFKRLEPEAIAIMERDIRAKRTLQRTASTERVIDVTLNGIEYIPEPGIREVVFFPSYLWRPWVVLTDHRDLKLIVYSVADESLATDGDEPPTRLIKLYKALGDERRLRILKKLSAADHSLQELADYLGLAKSTMHHHLTILRSAGLVRVRMNGAGDMQYSLRRDLIPDTATLLQGYLTA